MGDQVLIFKFAIAFVLEPPVTPGGEDTGVGIPFRRVGNPAPDGPEPFVGKIIS